jgi:hypothetical protein
VLQRILLIDHWLPQSHSSLFVSCCNDSLAASSLNCRYVLVNGFGWILEFNKNGRVATSTAISCQNDEFSQILILLMAKTILSLLHRLL